jgi:hypothetical protein
MHLAHGLDPSGTWNVTVLRHLDHIGAFPRDGHFQDFVSRMRAAETSRRHEVRLSRSGFPTC